MKNLQKTKSKEIGKINIQSDFYKSSIFMDISNIYKCYFLVDWSHYNTHCNILADNIYFWSWCSHHLVNKTKIAHYNFRHNCNCSEINYHNIQDNIWRLSRPCILSRIGRLGWEFHDIQPSRLETLYLIDCHHTTIVRVEMQIEPLLAGLWYFSRIWSGTLIGMLKIEMSWKDTM